VPTITITITITITSTTTVLAYPCTPQPSVLDSRRFQISCMASPSPIKTPDRYPHCNAGRAKITSRGTRKKKLETVRLFRCRSCGRTFTPGPRALRNKTYPLNEILEALTLYSRGYSLAETAAHLSSHHGHTVNAATISRWFAQHPRLTSYRRFRDHGCVLFKPTQVIRTLKLYHRQVYEFAYHRAKLAFPTQRPSRVAVG
jgi:transposase-like protein